ncbi:AtpZ/AtpI family protein [bacterium]|jgi:positive regulator of sigma E activity|nr:AtpZ/AtpI family protein [bacterium]
MKKKEANKYLSLVSKLGGTMIICILLFFYIGLSLDRYLNGSGILTILFMFIGIVIGFYIMFLYLKTFFEKESKF